MAFRTIIDGIGAITETSPGVFDTTGIIAEDVTSLPNDLLTGSCVVAGMQVSATSPASNEVSISAGKAWVENDVWAIGTDEQKYWPVNNDAAEQVTIPANASGNPRIDLVCVEVDPSASPGDDGAPNCDYVVVQGTPAGSPTPPAVPAKHTVLAQIAVANGFSTITGGDITDRRLFVRPQLFGVAQGTITPDVAVQSFVLGFRPKIVTFRNEYAAATNISRYMSGVSTIDDTHSAYATVSTSTNNRENRTNDYSVFRFQSSDETNFFECGKVTGWNADGFTFTWDATVGSLRYRWVAYA